MRGVFKLWVGITGLWLFAANVSFAQDPKSVPEEQAGPPHEDLFRAQETISAVLCKAPSKAIEQRRLDQKYENRVAKVQSAVAAEFGEKSANAAWVSILPCRGFLSDAAFQRSLRAAERDLSDVLKRWELRYGLGLKYNTKIRLLPSGSQRTPLRNAE